MLVTVLSRMIVSVRMIVTAVTFLAMAVFVVVMGAALTVLVVMTFRSMLMGMLVLPMIVVVPMDLTMAVGPAFRIEGRQNDRHRGAEPLQHILDDMIVADAQSVAEKLGRQMPVAEVPGDADEIGRAGGDNLKQTLGNRLHQDQPAVLEFEGVAILHHGRFLEIEKKYGLADAPHDKAATVTIVTLESERISGRAGPSTGGKNAGGGDHDISALADEGSDGWTSLAKSAAEASADTISARPSNAAAATPA